MPHLGPGARRPACWQPALAMHAASGCPALVTPAQRRRACAPGLPGARARPAAWQRPPSRHTCPACAARRGAHCLAGPPGARASAAALAAAPAPRHPPFSGRARGVAIPLGEAPPSARLPAPLIHRPRALQPLARLRPALDGEASAGARSVCARMRAALLRAPTRATGHPPLERLGFRRRAWVHPPGWHGVVCNSVRVVASDAW